ncbi:MAG: methylenetetrahydrofolate reductase C-terminal domain-containing protein [Nitrospira sp.]|nr:methylenetetrahydrofolate reductase C-terminal domain-containing protein [Nitrospira sp.]
MLITLNPFTLAPMPIRVLIPGEDDNGVHVGGVHKRPPIPDNTLKAECPKFMAHGPCGGVRKGGFCEVYPEMICPWVSLYLELEKIDQTEWMKQL